MTANKHEKILSKAKSILFNTEMVRAILDGRKTQTRRIVKQCHVDKFVIAKDGKLLGSFDGLDCYPSVDDCLYQFDDILYVRETFCKEDDKYYYRADFDSDYLDPCETLIGGYPSSCRYRNCDSCSIPSQRIIWHPSIHMPKEAARIFLRVTNVSVAKLQEIITGDYRTPININKEGLISSCCFCTHHNEDCKDYISQHTPKTLTCKLLEDFTLLWNSTIKKSDLYKYGWDANPWVWVIEFERID